MKRQKNVLFSIMTLIMLLSFQFLFSQIDQENCHFVKISGQAKEVKQSDIYDITGNNGNIMNPKTGKSPSVIIAQPNGGEYLVPGSTYEIQWMSMEIADNKFWLYYWDGEWHNIVSEYIDTDMTKRYNWNVPNIACNNCYVQVSGYDSGGNWISDMSDGGFIISELQANLTSVYSNCFLTVYSDRIEATHVTVNNGGVVTEGSCKLKWALDSGSNSYAIDEDNIPQLDPEETKTNICNKTFSDLRDSGIPPGDYTLYCVIDCYNEVSESNNGDNQCSWSSTITIPEEEPPVDAPIKTNPSDNAFLDTTTPTFNVQSVSNADYYGWWVWENGSVVIDPNNNGGYTSSNSFTPASGVLQFDQKYTWDCRAYNNNTGWGEASSDIRTFTTVTPVIDVEITSCTVSNNNPSIGSNVTIYATVKNNAGGSTSPVSSTVRFYDGDPDPNYDSNVNSNVLRSTEVISGDVSFSNLAAGSSTTVTKTFNISDDSYHKFCAIANPDNLVFDPDEYESLPSAKCRGIGDKAQLDVMVVFFTNNTDAGALDNTTKENVKNYIQDLKDFLYDNTLVLGLNVSFYEDNTAFDNNDLGTYNGHPWLSHDDNLLTDFMNDWTDNTFDVVIAFWSADGTLGAGGLATPPNYNFHGRTLLNSVPIKDTYGYESRQMTTIHEFLHSIDQLAHAGGDSGFKNPDEMGTQVSWNNPGGPDPNEWQYYRWMLEIIPTYAWFTPMVNTYINKSGNLSISSSTSGAEILIDDATKWVSTSEPTAYTPATLYNLAEGNHTWEIDGKTGSFTITKNNTTSLNIDNTSPANSIKTPANNSTVLPTQPCTSDASDTGGSIWKVEYWYKLLFGKGDWVFIGESSSGSNDYLVNWDTSPLTNGSYSLKSIAIDDSENETPVEVTVNVNLDCVEIVDQEQTLSSGGYSTSYPYRCGQSFTPQLSDLTAISLNIMIAPKPYATAYLELYEGGFDGTHIADTKPVTFTVYWAHWERFEFENPVILKTDGTKYAFKIRTDLQNWHFHTYSDVYPGGEQMAYTGRDLTFKTHALICGDDNLNLDFESDGGWNIEINPAASGGCAPTATIKDNGSHNGNYCAKVYNGAGCRPPAYNDRSCYISQSVTIPADKPYLHYYYKYDTYYYWGVQAKFRLVDNNNNVTYLYSHPAGGYNVPWTSRVNDLNAFAGQTVTLEICVIDNGYYAGMGDHKCTLRIDDIYFSGSNKGTVGTGGVTLIPETTEAETENLLVFPNPMSNELTVEYNVQSAGKVTIDVYDITGRKVQNLTDKYNELGRYTIQWDANDTNSSKTPNGTYFIRMQTEDNTQTTKVVLMR